MSLPWFSQQVRKFGVAAVTDASLLDGPAAEDRIEMQNVNVASVLASNMICDGVMYGSLGMGRSEPGHWPEESFAAIRVLGAALASVMSAARDRAALADAIRRGDQARESQQLFFSALGHELRTPISAIIGTVELLGDEAEDMAQQSLSSETDNTAPSAIMPRKSKHPRVDLPQPPYDGETAAAIELLGPSIQLFRVFARRPELARGITGWGHYYLSRESALSLRHRELVIDRTTARCGADYEWGVHLAIFAERAGLSDEQVRSLATGSHADPCWLVPADRAVLRAVDSLYDSHDLSDDAWSGLVAAVGEDGALELTLLCGWYHAISFAVRALRLPLEPDTAPIPTRAPRDSHVCERQVATCIHWPVFCDAGESSFDESPSSARQRD